MTELADFEHDWAQRCDSTSIIHNFLFSVSALRTLLLNMEKDFGSDSMRAKFVKIQIEFSSDGCDVFFLAHPITFSSQIFSAYFLRSIQMKNHNATTKDIRTMKKCIALTIWQTKKIMLHYKLCATFFLLLVIFPMPWGKIQHLYLSLRLAFLSSTIFHTFFITNHRQTTLLRLFCHL